MSSGMELFKQHIAARNVSVDLFTEAAEKIKKSIIQGKTGTQGRSLVKLDGTVYRFKLANKEMKIDGKDEALKVLSNLILAAHDESDAEFRVFIQREYPPESAKPKSERQSRTQAAEVHTDVLRFDLKNRPA